MLGMKSSKPCRYNDLVVGICHIYSVLLSITISLLTEYELSQHNDRPDGFKVCSMHRQSTQSIAALYYAGRSPAVPCVGVLSVRIFTSKGTLELETFHCSSISGSSGLVYRI